MAKRRTSGRPVTAKPGTKASYTNVLLEEIRAEVKGVAEAVVVQGKALERKIEEQGAHLSNRMDVLEMAVRKNSEDIRKNSEDIRKNTEDIRQNSEDIRSNTEDIRSVKSRLDEVLVKLDSKADASRVSALETRVDRLEGRANE